MFGWLFKDKTEKIEENVRKGFSDVRKDIDVAGKWIKHLDKQDKQLFDMIYSLREELSSVKSDI